MENGAWNAKVKSGTRWKTVRPAVSRWDATCVARFVVRRCAISGIIWLVAIFDEIPGYRRGPAGFRCREGVQNKFTMVESDACSTKAERDACNAMMKGSA